MIRHLLRSGRTEVLYLDAEMWIHGSLGALSQLSRTNSVVLVPHATAPLPEDGCGVNESDLLTAGVYNLGLLGVGAGSEHIFSIGGVDARDGRYEPIPSMT